MTTTSRRWLRHLAGLTAVATAGLAALNVAALAARYSAWLELATHFRPQYFVCALLALAVFLVARSKRWALLAAALALWNGALIGPVALAPLRAPAALNTANPSAPSLVVMHANVLTRNTEYAAMLAHIRARSPDVILLQEVDQRWLDALRVLHDEYPYRLLLPRDDNFGIAAYSRISGSDLRPMVLVRGAPMAIAARIPTTSADVHILSVHTLPPLGPELTAIRDRQLYAAAATVAAWPATKLLVGDLNITPWSPAFGDTLQRAGVRDARLRHGLKPSWPAYFRPAMIPIDHVLPGPGLSVAALERAWVDGSDHAAMTAQLSLAP